MIQSYKAVFFDAGGTLLYPYPSVGEIYQEVAARYGSKAAGHELQGRFLACWRRKDEISNPASHSSEKVEREWWRSLVADVFKDFGPLRDFEAFFDELYDLFARPEVWRLYPGVTDVLEALKKQGKKLVIVSNWDSRLFRLADFFKLNRYFDEILASAVVGASKPSAKIFKEALKRTGTAPGEAVHVGDSFEDDIQGAASAGIAAILVDYHGRPFPATNGAAKPLATIRDLRELV